MTNYPNSLDNNITLPGVSGVTQEDIAISALRDATFAIETELGITPSGIYSDVRARLDILESRINFSVSPSIPNDGYVKSPLFIWNVPSNVILTISDGYGVPTENRLNGSLFMRADGYANNDFYIRRAGAWSPIQTDPFVAAGDLMGNYLSQTVIGLYGKPLNSTMATVGATQDGYHLTWNNSIGKWEAQTGFIAASDLAADSAFFGRIGQRVVRIQNKNVSAQAPTDRQIFVWEATDNHWEPQEQAVVFSGSAASGDGYVTRVNIRSNKIQQSPSTNNAGLVGLVNFSTSTTGVGGTSANYATLLGGDQNAASGQFSLVTCGISGVANGLYASILNGQVNQATASFATVINGNGNQATATQAIVLDGYSNFATAINALVGTGGGNQANATYSTVLNGISNIIASGSTLSSILGGNGNNITGQNVFIGTASGANIQSNFSSVETGLNNIINAGSSFATIINGNTGTVSASSGFAFIGTGNNITVTGLYSTVLNSTGATANGLHSLILNGNTNSVTASFSTIGNGNNNTISGAGATAYATILDGYQNLVSGAGGLILDGYNNTINGQWSTIVNGNFNTINGRNSTILNGANNSIDASSVESSVIVGENNIFTNSANTTATGSGNTFTNAAQTFVIGTNNSIQSLASFINGSTNTLAAGTSFNRIFGSNNIINAETSTTFTIGNTNQTVNGASNVNMFGSNNIADGYSNMAINGSNNIANANFVNIHGQFGKARLFGQEVRSNARFTVGKVGEVQWSRLILDGYSTVAGTQFFCQLQDTTQPLPTNAFFVDGYSYDMQIRVLVVNTSPIGPNPVVPARFVFDVLAHQEGGTLVLDNINQTLITPQSSGTPWTVTIGVSGNQITVSVDLEAGPPYVQPTNTPSNRRAVATIEMREMSRL